MTARRVLYAGGQLAGTVGLITLQQEATVCGVVTQDADLEAFARRLGYPTYATLRGNPWLADVMRADLLVSVHSWEILPEAILATFRLGAINLHPCLWAYPGADPIGRWLRDAEAQWLLGVTPRASVGAHFMTVDVDAGPMICEEFVEVPRTPDMDRAAVYRFLYPLYGRVLRRALAAVACRAAEAVA